jgi:hypothetical protein
VTRGRLPLDVIVATELENVRRRTVDGRLRGLRGPARPTRELATDDIVGAEYVKKTGEKKKKGSGSGERDS